jgi:hypothetical protein
VAEQPSETNGSARPALPWILFAASTVVAVLATTGFVYLIAKRTTGPAEVLHEFYQAVHNGDCEESYSLLSEEARAGRTEREWCDDGAAGGLDLPASFVTESIELRDNVAAVEVRHPDGEERTWELARHEDTWRVSTLNGETAEDSPLRPPETPAG